MKNNCLEHLRVYKLEHQAWFNDIHKRLNLLLVDKKKVKFESLAKVASKWIIPISSDLKNLHGITEIQKLILIEVQVYRKIIELINKPLKGSFFESKKKAFQKRDNTLIMHAEAMARAYNNIVKAFNNLEKDIITKKVQCKLTVVSSTKTELKSNKTTTLKKEEAIKPIAISLIKETKPSSVSNLTKTTVITEQKISKKQTNTIKKEIAKDPVQKESAANKTEKSKEMPSKVVKESIALKDKTAINTINIYNMSYQDLLNTLNKNRKSENTKVVEAEEIFNLQEEIKRIIG